MSEDFLKTAKDHLKEAAKDVQKMLHLGHDEQGHKDLTKAAKENNVHSNAHLQKSGALPGLELSGSEHKAIKPGSFKASPDWHKQVADDKAKQPHAEQKPGSHGQRPSGDKFGGIKDEFKPSDKEPHGMKAPNEGKVQHADASHKSKPEQSHGEKPADHKPADQKPLAEQKPEQGHKPASEQKHADHSQEKKPEQSHSTKKPDEHISGTNASEKNPGFKTDHQAHKPFQQPKHEGGIVPKGFDERGKAPDVKDIKKSGEGSSGAHEPGGIVPKGFEKRNSGDKPPLQTGGDKPPTHAEGSKEKPPTQTEKPIHKDSVKSPTHVESPLATRLNWNTVRAGLGNTLHGGFGVLGIAGGISEIKEGAHQITHNNKVEGTLNVTAGVADVASGTGSVLTAIGKVGYVGLATKAGGVGSVISGVGETINGVRNHDAEKITEGGIKTGLGAVMLTSARFSPHASAAMVGWGAGRFIGSHATINGETIDHSVQRRADNMMNSTVNNEATKLSNERSALYGKQHEIIGQDLNQLEATGKTRQDLTEAVIGMQEEMEQRRNRNESTNELQTQLVQAIDQRGKISH